MPAMAIVFLSYLLIGLALMAVMIRRSRRRVVDEIRDPGLDGRSFNEMMMVETHMGSPPTGGAILPDARPQAISRGRRRH